MRLWLCFSWEQPPGTLRWWVFVADLGIYLVVGVGVGVSVGVGVGGFLWQLFAYIWS